MALDARSRASIYQALTPLIGEENANTLMSEFPSVEADELVTKQFLRAELGQLREELRAELHGEIGGMRAELHGEVGSLRVDMAERFHQQTVRLIGALGGAITVATAVLGTLITVR